MNDSPDLNSSMIKLNPIGSFDDLSPLAEEKEALDKIQRITNELYATHQEKAEKVKIDELLK